MRKICCLSRLPIINGCIVIISLLLLFACGKKVEKDVEEVDVQEVKKETPAKIVLAKDPRTIGPNKGKEQITIEENIYNINSSENPALWILGRCFWKE